MHSLLVLYYYGGGGIALPIFLLLFALIRLIIRLSRTSTPVNRPTQNPYQQNPYQQNPYQQNPYQQNPYQQNPYQQNPNMGFNPGQTQNNPYNPNQPFPQANNPFTPNPPVVPPNPYGNNQFIPPQQQNTEQDAFAQFAGNVNKADESGFYCKYCAKKFASLEALQRDTCFKHPKSEMGLQKHEWYTGVGKPNVGF